MHSMQSRQTLPHWEFVRKFLCRCNARDISEMQQHLNCFVDCFTECASSGNLTLHHFINKMCKAGFCARICPEENMAEVRERFIERMDALQETEQVRQMLLPQKEKLDGILEATMKDDVKDVNTIKAL
ncbi:unnamed protein product [Camellia sinensis]